MPELPACLHRSSVVALGCAFSPPPSRLSLSQDWRWPWACPLAVFKSFASAWIDLDCSWLSACVAALTWYADSRECTLLISFQSSLPELCLHLERIASEPDSRITDLAFKVPATIIYFRKLQTLNKVYGMVADKYPALGLLFGKYHAGISERRRSEVLRLFLMVQYAGALCISHVFGTQSRSTLAPTYSGPPPLRVLFATKGFGLVCLFA